MKVFAVIDTNVLVSALISEKENAATVQVISKFIAGEITPVFSTPVIDEYTDVLFRPKFHFPKDTVEYLLAAIKQFGFEVKQTHSNVSLPDKKDIPFYESFLTVQSENAYLITGNIKHFPKINHIVTPRQIIDILES